MNLICKKTNSINLEKVSTTNQPCLADLSEPLPHSDMPKLWLTCNSERAPNLDLLKLVTPYEAAMIDAYKRKNFVSCSIQDVWWLTGLPFYHKILKPRDFAEWRQYCEGTL